MKNWWFLVLVFSLYFGLNAQVTKEIKGNLVDMKTSYDVEEVELSLTSKKTGKVWITETNNDGEFTFKNIPENIKQSFIDNNCEGVLETEKYNTCLSIQKSLNKKNNEYNKLVNRFNTNNNTRNTNVQLLNEININNYIKN